MHMNKTCKNIKESRYKHTQMNIDEYLSILYISKGLRCGEGKAGDGCLSTPLPYWGRNCRYTCTLRKRRGREENLKTMNVTKKKRHKGREEKGKVF